MLEFLSIACVLTGLFFFLGTSIGLLRFPGFYTRMHAAGKADTLSTVLLLLGCILYLFASQGLNFMSILVSAKILLVVGFIFIGSPTATHALMAAGFETEVEHWKKGENS